MYEDVEGGEDCESCQNTDNTMLYDWDGVEAWLCHECAENHGAESFE
jgi:Zn ribbon nucleic-acid-binding protein